MHGYALWTWWRWRNNSPKFVIVHFVSMVALWWWDNNSFKAVIVHFVCMCTHYVMGQLYFQLSEDVLVHSVSTVTHCCHDGDGTSPCLHGYTLWWWDNDSSKSVTVHLVSMVAPWWWDNNNSKAVICPFCVHGYRLLWWDNDTSNAVIVHSVSTVTHYCHDGDGTSPCTWIHIMVMGQR